ncbi:lytic transglycosylase domain-containing protein [Sphingomonas mollis]|uniref:Lytic transglycosylase domain-containing protein n=1 Tax=Sphingomonas mollis TaxID=2795726 RepID=A0ABS0XUC3_9SPHN|nr:lytic transglycosylase domain-containing protein [Sphingomonas sp. BT553]MBJ6123623.1 lytic transglycosylase domain-containing protein [Sphingomonas sp. BT553]
MILDVPAITILAQACAPSVHSKTMAAIVMTESGGNELAINVNGARNPRPAANLATAIQTARAYIAAGYSVDLGLAQINSRNLGRLGLTIEQMFVPCANLAASARILSMNYRAAGRAGHAQQALRVAFSMYNTGHPVRGFGNGYVARVERAGAALGNYQRVSIAAGTLNESARVVTTVPSMPILPAERAPRATTVSDPSEGMPAVAPALWNVFALPADRRVVLFQSDPL